MHVPICTQLLIHFFIISDAVRQIIEDKGEMGEKRGSTVKTDNFCDRKLYRMGVYPREGTLHINQQGGQDLKKIITP